MEYGPSRDNVCLIWNASFFQAIYQNQGVLNYYNLEHPDQNQNKRYLKNRGLRN